MHRNEKLRLAYKIGMVLYNLPLVQPKVEQDPRVLDLVKRHNGDVLADWAREAQGITSAQIAFSHLTMIPIEGRTHIVYNNITGDGKMPIMLKDGTPPYCDPSCESYHSM